MPGYTVGSISLRNVGISFGFVDCFAVLFCFRPDTAQAGIQLTPSNPLTLAPPVCRFQAPDTMHGLLFLMV